MAYDFRIINKENEKLLNELKIQVDDEMLNNNKEYNFKAKKLLFENKNGKILIEGYLDIPRNGFKFNEIVKIHKYSAKFDHKFVESNSHKDMYKGVTVTFVFYNIKDSKLLNSQEIKNYANEMSLKIVYSTTQPLTIISKKIQDIDLRIVSNRIMDENMDFNRSFSGFSVDLMKKEPEHFIPNLNYHKKKIKDESGLVRSFEEELEPREKIVEIPNDVYISKFTTNYKDNFIDFESDIIAFEFNVDKLRNQNKKFIDPYHIQNDGGNEIRKFRKGYFNNSFKVCFNHKGEFITVGMFNNNTFRHKLNINKITPNKNLKLTDIPERSNLLYSYYNKNTFLNYLNILHLRMENILTKNQFSSKKLFEDSKLQLKGSSNVSNSNNITNISIDQLGVNDYTYIINDYINDLIKNRDSLDSLKTNLDNNKQYIEVKKLLSEKLTKEISVLKLFQCLFLNSFIDNYNDPKSLSIDRNEVNSAQVESYREEVKRMRKKILNEWLVKDLDKNYNDIYKEIDQIKHKNTTYKLILHCLLSGKIRKAQELCNKIGLFDLSTILCQTNNDVKSSLVKNSIDHWKKLNVYQSLPEDLKKIYSVLSSGTNDEIKSAYKDWRQLMLLNSIYTMPELSTVSQLISNLPNTNDLNFHLISFYAEIENNRENTNIITELADNSNVFLDFSDNHLNFIIITILLNTLRETYNTSFIKQSGSITNKAINYQLLKQLHFKLLIKVVEEFLCADGEGSEMNWKYSISLIRNSNISKRIQKLLINDILHKFIDLAKTDLYFLNKNEFDNKVTNDALGLSYYSQFKFNEAYENFKKAEKYDRANEIFIFNKLCLRILEGEFSNEIIEELHHLSKFSKYIDNWEKYGSIFIEYISIIKRKNFEIKELYSILGLIKKVDAMNTTKHTIYFNLINSCRNIMLLNLRRIYNCITNKENKHNEFHFCITPNLNWIKNSNVDLEIKRFEFNQSLESLIQLKSKTYALNDSTIKFSQL